MLTRLRVTYIAVVCLTFQIHILQYNRISRVLWPIVLSQPAAFMMCIVNLFSLSLSVRRRPEIGSGIQMIDVFTDNKLPKRVSAVLLMILNRQRF